MRLQEIRERIEQRRWMRTLNNNHHTIKIVDQDQLDFDYLIERLERYEAALKDIMHKGKFIDTVEECCYIAEEALKEDINPIGLNPYF